MHQEIIKNQQWIEEYRLPNFRGNLCRKIAKSWIPRKRFRVGSQFGSKGNEPSKSKEIDYQ